MRYRDLVAGLVVGALVGVGCQHRHSSEPDRTVESDPAPVEVQGRPQAHGSSREPRTVVSQGVPTEEDYEAEAAARINAKNLEAELAKLEAEISPN